MSSGDEGRTNTAGEGFEAFSTALRMSWSPELPSLVALCRTGSTNALARRVVDHYLLDELAPPRLVVVAYGQSTGRGRLGRRWSSPPGTGAWISVLLPNPSPQLLAVLPLLVGVTVIESLSVLARESVAAGGGSGDSVLRRLRLKWPNDIILDGRKLGGILIEAVHRGVVGAAVVGVGVNLLAVPEDQPQAAALADLAAAESSLPAGERLGVMVARLLTQLVGALDAGDLPPAAVLVERFAGWSGLEPGAPIRFSTGAGVVEGELLGFAADGRLRLLVAGREELYAAGEVIER